MHTPTQCYSHTAHRRSLPAYRRVDLREAVDAVRHGAMIYYDAREGHGQLPAHVDGQREPLELWRAIHNVASSAVQQPESAV